MKSIFNTTDNQEIVDRIQALTPDTKAIWGKMNVAQMLAHMLVPIKVSLGEVKLKRGLIGMLFGKLAKKKMVNEDEFSRNLPTDPNFIIKVQPDFEEAKQKLINLVQTLAEKGPQGLSNEPHPFFGPMSSQDWDTLTWKHLDHHLRQFGK